MKLLRASSFYGLAAAAACLTSIAAGQESSWGPSDEDKEDMPPVTKTIVSVGMKNPRPVCDATGQDAGCSVSLQLMSALENDERLTVTGVEVGELICDTLDSAEGADQLAFVLDTNEEVTATMKSFHAVGGAAFTDKAARKVWTGVVDEKDDFKGVPRMISMTWSGCNIQTFMLKVITFSTDGSSHWTVSAPCDDSEDTLNLCVVKISREGEDESEEEGKGLVPPVRRLGAPREDKVAGSPRKWGLSRRLEERRKLAAVVEAGIEQAKLDDPDISAKDEDIRLLSEYLSAPLHEKEAFHERGVRRLSPEKVVMPSGRILQGSNTIDVMVLVTKNARYESNSMQGGTRTEAQLETDIITAYEEANNALADSGVDVELRVVHIESIDYQEPGSISDTVYELYEGGVPGIHDLRDKYGADLVQLVGFYSSTCGIGFTMQSPSSGFAQYGYSVVHTNCLSNFSHIHEIGHNMGANHDRDNSATPHEYAHAHRYCSGDTPYRTIMAYETDCREAPRVNVFSTPDKSFSGKPQGTETTNNARVIQEALSVVINFRDASVEGEGSGSAPAPAPPAPGPAPGPESTTPGASIYPEKIHDKRMDRRGCYRDDSSDRVMMDGTEMPTIDGKTIGMTLDNCMAYCYGRSEKYKYFGAEHGNECFCGGEDKHYKSLGRINNKHCDMKCAGDSSKTCGGYDAIEVFSMKNLDYDEDVSPPSYEGCYRHSGSELEMANQPVVDFSHTDHEVCHMHCNTAGFAYFALEFGFKCSCGDKLPDKSLMAELSDCNLPCSSPETTRKCGGNWHLAVFAVGTSEGGDDDSGDAEGDELWGPDEFGEGDDDSSDNDEGMQEKDAVVLPSPGESPIKHDAVTANDDDDVQMQKQQQTVGASAVGAGDDDDEDDQEDEPVVHPSPTGSPISHGSEPEDDDDEVEKLQHHQTGP